MSHPLYEAVKRIDLLHAAAAVAALSVLIRVLACFSSQSDWDVYAFALVARDIVAGKLPYQGVFDSKPVGLNYIFAATQLAFGSTVFSIQVVGLMSATVAAAIVYDCCRLLVARADARFCFAVAAIYLALSIKNDGVSSMSELVANPFVAAAIDFILRWRMRLFPYRLAAFAIGAVFGLACQITYFLVPAFGFVAIVCGVIILRDDEPIATKAVAVLLAGLGFAAAFGSALIPIAVFSDVTQYFVLQFRYHSVYRQEDMKASDIAVNLLICAQIFLPFIYVVYRACRKRVLRGAIGARRSFFVILAVMFAGTAISIAIPNRFPGHYFLLLLPTLVILMAVLMLELGELQRGVALLIGLIVSGLMMTRPAVRAYEALSIPTLEDQISTYVKSITKPSDYVLIICESHVPYFLSGRRVPTHFVFELHYLDKEISSKFVGARQVFEEGMSKNPAAVIAGYCGEALDVSRELSERNYRPARTFQEDNRVVHVYTKPM